LLKQVKYSLTYPAKVPVRVIVITLNPVVDDSNLRKRIADLYMVPSRRIANVRTTGNHKFEIPLFKVVHYSHYFMEETATDESPLLICYHDDDDEVMKSLTGSIGRYLKDASRTVNLLRPQSYEEAFSGKVYELSKSSGTKPLPVYNRANVFTGVWSITGGETNRFKDEFYKVSRMSAFKVVDSKK
jgi:hypothetical protein